MHGTCSQEWTDHQYWQQQTAPQGKASHHLSARHGSVKNFIANSTKGKMNENQLSRVICHMHSTTLTETNGGFIKIRVVEYVEIRDDVLRSRSKVKLVFDIILKGAICQRWTFGA